MTNEGRQSLRGMRNNFGAMKDELSTSLRFISENSAQFHYQFFRVVNVITELLLSGIECLDDQPGFNITIKLAAAFKILDKCNNPMDAQHTALVNFARSFLLFMDALNGSSFSHRNYSVEKELRLLPGKTYEANGACKRPRPLAEQANDVVGPAVASDANMMAAKKARACIPKALFGKIIPTRPRHVRPAIKTTSRGTAHNFSIDSNTTTLPGPPDTLVKEELLDDVSDIHHGASNSESPQPPQLFLPGSPEGDVEVSEMPLFAEVKQEVKEEPVEQPIADVVPLSSFSASAPSTSSAIPPVDLAQSLSRAGFPKPVLRPFGPTARPPEKQQEGTTLCNICNKIMNIGHLETHTRQFHKDNWLETVFKCDDQHCDFRSSDERVIERHYLIVHTQYYAKRVPKMKTSFEQGRCNTSNIARSERTRCPYCSDSITTFERFNAHMEQHHQRLCSYEAKILYCVACKYACAHTYELLLHWTKKDPICTQGAGFNYAVANYTQEADERMQLEEIDRSSLNDNW